MVKIDNAKNAKKYLKGKNFYFLEKFDLIQGEEYPQGLCITEEYIFISMYSGIRSDLGKVKVFDKNSGEYLLSLGMDKKSHLGGITYDGTYIWVCNSSKMSLERLSYALIKQMIREHKGKMIDVRNIVDVYGVKNIPSCVTYYDGYLLVATHSIFTNALMMQYKFDQIDNKLYMQEAFLVPPKTQGITFNNNGEVYVSTSYGRMNSSYIKKYNSIYSMTNNTKNYVEKIKLPPCSEEIVFENNKLYVLFESAGKKYLEGTDGKGKSITPIDKILVIEDK